MAEKPGTRNSIGIDKGLIMMYLKMSIEERLEANDNAVRTILELRDGFKQQNNKSGLKHTT